MKIRNIGSPQGIDHDLKHDRTWNSKMKEHFKIGEIIGGEQYFVKRYDTRVPTAKALLTHLWQDTERGITVANIPKVYDLAEQIEGQKRVYYYVTECLDGQTLDIFLKKQPAALINLKLLYFHLSRALKEIHQRNFWFSDFNDQNIFFAPTLNCFYLIDVDSAWSNDEKPAGDAGLSGGLPGASLRYADLVTLFCQKHLNLPKFDFSQLAGNALNYLQLLVFVAHLRSYQKFQETDKRLPFGQSLNPSLLIDNIYAVDADLCQSVFEKARQGKLDYTFLGDLGKLIDKIIAFDGWKKTKVVPVEPVQKPISGQKLEIISFKSSIVQKDLIINSEDTVYLTWIVLGSKPDGITLNGNVMPKNRGKATLNPTRTTTYTLVATDIHGKTEQEAITIKVQQNVSVWKWVVGVMVSAACLLGGYTLLDNYWIDSIPLEQAFETGKSAYRKGEYKKARRLMTRCIEQNEHRSEAYYWRGVAFFKTKNHGEGCKDIQQAAKSLPNDRNVKDACATQCNCN